MYSINPFSYSGSIEVPASKSDLQRAIAVAVLNSGSTRIIGNSESDDVKAAIEIARQLGTTVNVKNDSIELTGGKFDQGNVRIHCGESGLSTRMFSPIAAVISNDVTIQGEGSILERPMNMVIDALTKLGADVKSTASTIPMRIQNGISAGEIEIDGSESSQLLTGLLIALPFAGAPSKLHVNNLKSKPYIDLTLKALRSFGIDVEHDDYKTFRIHPQKLDKDVDYTVESDWSGAAFHIVGAAISGTIELVGLDEDSTQADKSIVEAVIGCGAKVNWLNGKLQVSKSSLNAFEFDATDCPDLFPPLSALASCCSGVSKISGVHRLKHKESDRAQTIQKELQNLGIHVAVEGDQLVVHGGRIIGGMVHSHNDHRIAMMCAVLASVSDSPIDIMGHTAINKSYPSFYKDLEMMNH